MSPAERWRCTPAFPTWGRQREAELCEFQASLYYRESSKAPRATHRNLVLEKEKKKKGRKKRKEKKRKEKKRKEKGKEKKRERERKKRKRKRKLERES